MATIAEQASSTTDPGDYGARFGALFGMGRSGTTWLGALINSHPDVAYRFEPFHRLRNRPEVRRARELMESESFSDEDLPTVYKALLTADPMVEKPPFHSKSYFQAPGRYPLWVLSRKIKSMGKLFEKAYTPTSKPYLIFKEVTLAPLMEKILERTSASIVYLVRHPCGTVASLLKGQAEGHMPSERFALLKQLLEAHDPALLDRLGPDKIDDLSPARKNALIYRMEIERAVRALDEHKGGMLCVYENLCREPGKVTDEVFAHLGLSRSEQTATFVETSTNPKPNRRDNGYFAVIRSPLESMEKWRKQLSKEQIDEILEMLAESPAYQKCATLGRW